MENRSHTARGNEIGIKDKNGMPKKHDRFTSNEHCTNQEPGKVTSGDNTSSSSDDDDTLSNKSGNGDDGENEDDDVLMDTPMGSFSDTTILPNDNTELKFDCSKDANEPSEETKRDKSHEGSPVFYLEPSEWEKANHKKAMDYYRSTSSPLSSSPKIDDTSSHQIYIPASKPNSCPRIPSPLSLVIPSNGTSSIPKPALPSCRRLLSPQTVYNPLLSRLHQSESMQTLPEYSSCDCTGETGSLNKTGERVRSFSSSSNPKSCHNLYRQSFGSGSFSGRVSPLARSESVFFASPVKRGCVANETMGIPINNRSTGLPQKRIPVSFNHLRHRKTAIPLLCSRSAAMVRYFHISVSEILG